MKILTPDFYNRDTQIVAQELLGTIMVSVIDGIFVSGMIIETEAYKGVDDPASHAYRGKTVRNAALFGPVGRGYVYFIYGNHFCFNVVARASDTVAGGVLIRALKPIEGIAQMHTRRGGTVSMKNLLNGPGKLTQALGITRVHNGLDITNNNQLYIVQAPLDLPVITPIASARIGIRVGQDLLWRFYSPF